jgi:hypothetical protein
MAPPLVTVASGRLGRMEEECPRGRRHGEEGRRVRRCAPARAVAAAAGEMDMKLLRLSRWAAMTVRAESTHPWEKRGVLTGAGLFTLTSSRLSRLASPVSLGRRRALHHEANQKVSHAVASLFFVHGICWRFFWGRCIRNLLEMDLFPGTKLGGTHGGVVSFSECRGESSWRQSKGLTSTDSASRHVDAFCIAV